MQNNDKWPEDYDPDAPKSRSSSRRNSASLTRRSSAKKEKEGRKKSPLNSNPSSSNSTPKNVVKPPNLDFVVTGKQILKRSDRANSLPGSYHRRPSADSVTKKKTVETKRVPVTPQSSNSQETSLEDDMSLDLSQVSDFEDTLSKYGIKKTPLATSTPKMKQHKQRCSLQTSMLSQKMESSRCQKETEKEKNRDSTLSSREDSVCRSSSASQRYAASTELDYSSVSPEYSGQSSAELSPRTSLLTRGTDVTVSPRSQELQSSCCLSNTWQECSEDNTKVEDCSRRDQNGEWNNFWANYNNSVAKVPMKSFYDQCPTPYRTENIDLADLDFSTDGSRKRSPENVKNINKIIRTEGLHLTPRETQNIIKCAHILGNVLTKAIERRTREQDLVEEKVQELNTERPEPEVEIKKKTMTLDLKETNIPLEVKEEKRSETVMTQTDISLPNTKSAPRIFERILRQLSKSSLEETLEKISVDIKEKEEKTEVKKDNKEQN